MRLTLEQLVEATGGSAAGQGDLSFDGISTDSRRPAPGSLFVALRGPRHDAHDFLDDAVARGARGAVIDHGDAPAGLAVVRVDDTLEALGRLARWVRNRLRLRVVAVTGSVGKTTTKEMTASLLRAGGLRTLQSPGNWNNLVGLPLTLLGAHGDEQAAVLELGISEPGEMARLTRICEPDVAVVTTVAECHTEGLGCLETVAREKMAIVEGLRPGGTVVLPAGDPLLRPPPGVRTVTFGWDPTADVAGSGWESLPGGGSRFRAGTLSVELRLPGRHNATNALAALAAVRALGAECPRASEALGSLRPPSLRGEIRETSAGAHLLVDCYNANPRAMEAALETLGELAGAGRKIAVLGEMRELGALAREGHLRIGRAAAKLGVEELHLLGRATTWVREGATAAGMPAERVWVYDDREALAAAAARRIRPGDWILVKGSRAMGLEAVAESLEAR